MLRILLRPGFLLLLALGLGASFAAVSSRGAPAPVAGRHKVQVSDPALGQQLVAQGARLIADYGAFQLYETAALSKELLNSGKVEVRDEYNTIQLNAVLLDTTTPAVRALRKPLGTFSGKRLHLVHYAGPIQPAWREALVKAGVQVVAYLPHNAYLIYGDAASLARVQQAATAAPAVQWEGPYADAYKIDPAARVVDAKGNPRVIGTEEFAIQLVDDPGANPATLQLLERLKLEPIRRQEVVQQYRNVVVRLNAKDLPSIAAQPEVVSIQPYFPKHKFCERQDQIVAGNLTGSVPTSPGYLAWLASKGFTQAQFTASGFGVDVSDSGIDNATTFPNHFGLYTLGTNANPSRIIYNRLVGTPNAGSTLKGCDGHGTINTHIIGGYNDLSGFPHTDAAGYHYGLGVCPFVKLGSSVVFDPNNFTSPNYFDLQSRAYNDGARVSNNSWGADSAGTYTIDSQSYDALVRDAQPTGSTIPSPGNQEMVIVFANGNAGPGTRTVGDPATAKNVISVGAAENVQAFGGSDNCGIADSGANSANDLIGFSSRGPCLDGRHKPELVAPGTHVSGGVIQILNPPPTGAADGCFTGGGVCGGVGIDFFPAGQQFFTASSGTSHSTPGVVGGCALLRQYFINNLTNPPSPAMTKAYLMNSARYLNGTGANDNLWSDNQGMGEMNLGMAFDGTPRILRDEVGADLLTASGQTRSFVGAISDTNKSFRVTIAWTDAPGSTTGNAFNNNLDLTVIVGGNTYKGNVFSGAFSVPGGSADVRNNVESVFLPAGVSGNFAVTVTAANIVSDGVPNNASPLDQDFALVVYNATPIAGAAIVGNGAALVAEGCAPTNGVIDPGEAVTVMFSLQNVGLTATANLVATLQASGGVTAPSGPQSYGVVTGGGPVVSRAFSFSASGACGGTLTATLQLQDGTTNLGTASFNFPLGKPVATTNYTENLDGVTAPALPAGWTTTTSGAQSVWAGTTVQRDTLPNSAFSTDANNVGVNELVSPVIPIGASAGQLTFRNWYNTESGYDGGVLEIKMGAGSFTDIVAVGGSFVSGGYNATLSTLYSNPLAGRAAWSGNAGGFVTTVVNLPAAAAGQNIQLRWRCGSDSSIGSTGWYVDSIMLTSSSYVCCSSITSPTISHISVAGGVSISFNSSVGVNYVLEYKNALTDAVWTPLLPAVPGTGGTMVLQDTSPLVGQRFYHVHGTY